MLVNISNRRLSSVRILRSLLSHINLYSCPRTKRDSSFILKMFSSANNIISVTVTSHCYNFFSKNLSKMLVKL